MHMAALSHHFMRRSCTLCHAFSRKPPTRIVDFQWVAKPPLPASITCISVPDDSLVVDTSIPRCRVEPMVAHPAPPTDPHVRNSRMRFLRQSSSYPYVLSSGGVVTRLASSESLSCIVPTGTLCPTSPSLQWVAWVSLPHLRRYYATLRLPPGPLGVLRLSLVPRYLACSSRSWCPRRARRLVEAPSPRQGLWSPGPPVRDVRQGARGLSQVPEFPLWTHAPLSDPGGVLRTRQSAPRTAAFRPLKTVG